LGIIGDCTASALIDERGRIVWACFPDFEGDAVFCSFLSPTIDEGLWSFELEDCVSTEQLYLKNTCTLVTRLTDSQGGVGEITDSAPRHKQHDRMYHPLMNLRHIVPIQRPPRLGTQM